jgi:para-aminobenzoate synthetase/4-amino-4-deoxychorismate lyase
MIEEATQRDGLYAAGFISYEAAPAFDPSLSVKDDGKFPMLWFGLFERVEELELLPNAAASPPSVRWHPSVEPEEYRRCVHKIHEFIQNGDTYQVNFTYRLNAKTSVDPWRLFTDIAGNGEAPFAAFVDTGDWAVCSASPELFLRLDGENMESRPMKGTAARGLWFEDDRKKRKELRNSEKERAENVMITDMVRNDLGRVAMGGSVHVSSLFEIEKYPTVWQMTSTVRARTHEPLDRILKAAFPPASITGAPKCRTMEIIRDLESSPRRIYTGTVGFVTPGRYAQFNVAIRTVLLNKKTGHAEYGVGGGIVWDSKSPAEYEECLTKTKVLNPSARNFDLIETMLWTPQDGYPFLYYHLRRLARSADYFGFKVDLHKIRNKLSDVASGLALEPHRVRLLVSRCGKIKCEATPVGSASMDFGRVTLAESPIDRGDIFMYHKTTRRHVYEDAVAMSPESDDVLLFNEAGQITESTIANIALEIDGMFYTPPVSCGLLPGTRRAWMLDRAGLLERVISVGEVLESPNVYLMNSVRGMHKINIDTSGGPMASNRES